MNVLLPSDSELRDLAHGPESESLELKANVRDPRSVARVAAALANTGGGLLIVGADERRGLVGVADPDHAERLVRRGIGMVLPPIAAQVQLRWIDQRPVVLAAIEAPRSDGPYIGPDGAVVRRMAGGKVVPLAVPDALRALSRVTGTQGASEQEQLFAAIAELQRRIADLQTSHGEEARLAAEERASQAEERLQQAETRAADAEHRADEAEQRIRARAWQRESRAAREETRAAAADAKRSRSFGPTALGWVGGGIVGFLIAVIGNALVGHS